VLGDGHVSTISSDVGANSLRCAVTDLQQQQQWQEEQQQEEEEEEEEQQQWQPGIQPQAVQLGAALVTCTTIHTDKVAAAAPEHGLRPPPPAAAMSEAAGASHPLATLQGSREWQKQLVGAIKAANCWEDLHDLLTQHGTDMDCISVTTVVTQAAALYRQSPSSAGAVREAVLQHVVPFVLTKVALLDPSGLVNILHKLSVMEVKHEELYTRLVRAGPWLLAYRWCPHAVAPQLCLAGCAAALAHISLLHHL
jgi:hypothetical protein